MIHPRRFSFAPDNLSRIFAATNTSLAFWSRGSTGDLSQGSNSGAGSPSAPALIYAVDDMPCLTELYALVLEASGYRVRNFNNRRAALAALKTEKPALLITDLRNASMSIDLFLHECLVVHPDIRILMATGFDENRASLCSITPDRFLQKPFTPEELQREVRAALADAPADCAR